MSHDSRMRPLHELTVFEAREAELSRLDDTPGEHVAGAVERRVPGPGGEIRVRFYLPDVQSPPVLVYFFGGGWTLGSLESVDPVCRSLVNAVPCAVASVDYRWAPEHPFPAGLEDCYAATCWVAERGEELGLDPGRVAVGGASAGGNLAAAVALLVRERRGPRIAFQLLVYPPLDTHVPASADEWTCSNDFGAEDLAWCWFHYLRCPADGEAEARALAASALGLAFHAGGP